ncbi:hypothetical protein EG68_02309 [Paragonimus skrjabini miyazakii]|uniref:Outer dynein arm-docking complex subunit 4 n=1 Tax=Paragonimus skrjabini miyazakii TaxID=59628 RepID=A0A8S9Z5P5_9TREM|nr:hypothetical protein EG68_02309 [Paragonimus skrjabini miyazakii]
MSEDSSEQPAFKSVDAYYAIARTLQVRKEYKRALFYLALALRQDDKHISSYLLRSLCYMYLCETDQALADVQTVLQYEPKNPHGLLLLGEIYYLRGDFEEALRTFHQGRDLRPTIQQFLVGVHKCEAAIQNSCNDCTIRLNPDLDLTEFYQHAFPPKRQARAGKLILSKGNHGQSDDGVPAWPCERSREMQRKLMKQSYSDFNYLDKAYRSEANRIQEFKRGKVEVFPDLNAMFERSRENRCAAVRCGIYLDKHADLFHKLDPGFRHTRSDL